MNQEENDFNLIAFTEVRKLRRQVFQAERNLEKQARIEKRYLSGRKEVQAKLCADSYVLTSRIEELQARKKENELHAAEFFEEINKLRSTESRLKDLQSQTVELTKSEAIFEKRSEVARNKLGIERNKPKFSTPSTKFEQQLDLLVNSFNSIRCDNQIGRKALEEIILKHTLIKERIVNKELQWMNEQRAVDRLIERASNFLVEREENVEKRRVYDGRLVIILTKHAQDTEDAKRKNEEMKTMQNYIATKKKQRGKEQENKSKRETQIVEAQNESSKWNEYFQKSEGKNLMQMLTLVKTVLNDNVALFQNLGQLSLQLQNQPQIKEKQITKTLESSSPQNNVSKVKSLSHQERKYIQDIMMLLSIPKTSILNTSSNDELLFKLIEERILELVKY